MRALYTLASLYENMGPKYTSLENLGAVQTPLGHASVFLTRQEMSGLYYRLEKVDLMLCA